MHKSRDLNNSLEVFEQIKKEPFINLVKKKGSFISLNNFRKLRENMHLLKKPFKVINSLHLFTYNFKLNSKNVYLKKALIFSYFFKTAFLQLRLKAKKAYKDNIKNFIRFSRMSL